MRYITLGREVPCESFGSGQDILDWPVFENKYDRRLIEALIFDPALPCNILQNSCTSPQLTDDSIRNSYEDPRKSQGSGIGICEDSVPGLVEIFLVNVHVKNPILDPEYLRSMARGVVEHGFDWKASSCLILVVCALASISSRFLHHSTSTVRGIGEIDNSLSNTPDYGSAESYYAAACKRIGLLRNTLLATECYFMTGVYEMYSLRPLQAAVSFNRACVTFQTLTWMRMEYQVTEDQLGKARASRLYWSCLKSEHETSIEIRFPSSGLTKLNYTSHFPAPPVATSTEDFFRMHNDLSGIDDSMSPSISHSELEESWYYYLADIAARRILQRVIGAFYESDHPTWINIPFQSMSQTAVELDRQLAEWHRTLPELVSFDFESGATSELAYHLQARALEIRERIYRPFLYRRIHGEASLPEQPALRSLAETHSITCARLIRQWNIRHRHHGTWLMVRQSFTAALLLLAAREAGVLDLASEQCDLGVQQTVSTLRYWEDEAPDLKASRMILEDLATRFSARR